MDDWKILNDGKRACADFEKSCNYFSYPGESSTALYFSFSINFIPPIAVRSASGIIMFPSSV